MKLPVPQPLNFLTYIVKFPYPIHTTYRKRLWEAGDNLYGIGVTRLCRLLQLTREDYLKEKQTTSLIDTEKWKLLGFVFVAIMGRSLLLLLLGLIIAISLKDINFLSIAAGLGYLAFLYLLWAVYERLTDLVMYKLLCRIYTLFGDESPINTSK